MKTLNDILQKTDKIKELIEGWGYANPRLFKDPLGKNFGHLYITVVPIDEEPFMNASLGRHLETELGCNVAVTPEQMLEDDFRDKILGEAISLDNKKALLEYYGNENYEFDLPDKKFQTPSEIRASESIFNFLVEERKRKRGEEDNRLVIVKRNDLEKANGTPQSNSTSQSFVSKKLRIS